MSSVLIVLLRLFPVIFLNQVLANLCHVYFVHPLNILIKITVITRQSKIEIESINLKILIISTIFEKIDKGIS